MGARVSWTVEGKGLLTGLLVAMLFAPMQALGLRVGNQLIQEGDSKLEVLDLLGEPALKERLESPEGGTIGWRYHYRLRSGATEKEVILHIRGGEVVDIDQELKH